MLLLMSNHFLRFCVFYKIFWGSSLFGVPVVGWIKKETCLILNSYKSLNQKSPVKFPVFVARMNMWIPTREIKYKVRKNTSCGIIIFKTKPLSQNAWSHHMWITEWLQLANLAVPKTFFHTNSVTVQVILGSVNSSTTKYYY